MSLEPFQKKLKDELVQRLKGKYGKKAESITAKDPFLRMVAGKVKYLDDLGRYSDLVLPFRLDVNRRLRDVEKLMGMYELGKIEPKNVWERYSALVPEELEDLAQSLGMTDILSRIDALRERLIAIDQEKNPVLEDVTSIYNPERLEVKKEYLRSKRIQKSTGVRKKGQKKGLPQAHDGR